MSDLCAMSKKIFFASDFHLGADARLTSREREQQVVRWLDFAAPEAEKIYLVGDLFEFWFEYGAVVPRGYTRLLGKLAALRDQGIPIEVFTGNHDLWMFDYFEQELGIPVHRKPIQATHGGKRFFIGHGDGLGPGDRGFKLMKKVFTAPLNQWLFKWLHPDLGAKLAHFFSKKSRQATSPAEKKWLGDRDEWLLQYCERKISRGTEADYFIFGHRHLPIDWLLSDGKTRYINLGEWMYACTYAVFDGDNISLELFDGGDPNTILYSNFG